MNPMMSNAGMGMAIAHASLLLAVSFFILMSLKKADGQALKAFGWVVAALLWLSTLAVLAGGMRTHRDIRPGMMPGMRGDRYEQRKDRMQDGRDGRIQRDGRSDRRGDRPGRMESPQE